VPNPLPVWIEILKASLGPAVALLAVVIAFIQWRTAHQKVVLDLFDRRMKTYEAASTVVKTLIGSLPNEYHIRDLDRVRSDARFLFGPDVVAYLQQIHDLAVEAGAIEIELRGIDEPADRQAISKKKWANLREIAEFYDIFPGLCEPYMKMDQKLIRSPVEWLRDMSSWVMKRILIMRERLMDWLKSKGYLK
jgi:hypothetical protein